MTDQVKRAGGGLGAVPGGPQLSTVAVSGRRPAVEAPLVLGVTKLVSDANEDDPEVVRGGDRRSWGILVRRGFGHAPSNEGRRS
jgi:hypothetical protein